MNSFTACFALHGTDVGFVIRGRRERFHGMLTKVQRQQFHRMLT